MKALLVNGSPHKNGCTHTALELVAESLREEGIETDEFWIGSKAIAGCTGCYTCREKGSCIFEGDKVEEFLAIANDYDAYVFGAPVYYAGMAGSMKAFLDRAFFSNSGRVKFELKPAAVVTSARRAGTTSTLEQLEKFIQIQQMIQVNSRYWHMVHGHTPEQVMQDEEGVQIMQVLGKNMAYTMKCLEAGKAQGLEEPAEVERIGTNFIR